MRKTQNSLDANKVTLDYQALLTCSKVAYSRCIQQIGKHLHDLQASPKHIPYLPAEWLLKEAEFLLIVTETMHTLEEGLNRLELVIVNKPEVEDEP